MSPVEAAPKEIVLTPLASIVKAPVPEIAVPDTLSELTAVAVKVPPDTLPPLKVPPDRVDPLIVPSQIKLPLPLLMVQPVEPLPPASRTLPVEMPPMETFPVVPASTVKPVSYTHLRAHETDSYLV